MFQSNLWCYLWDLVDEGIDDTLDRLIGEAGVTGISIATTYHSIDQLRPHPGVTPRRFRSPGGLAFQPHMEKYVDARIRPIIASWLGARNPLTDLGEACAKRGLTLRGWTVCCHSSLLAGRHESCAVKNVFGDIDPTWLCPVNPDVGEYLNLLIEDLCNHYPFETIELERPSFQYRPHVHAHHKVGVELGETGQWLYRLCFCASCRRAAEKDSVDVEAAVHATTRTLEEIFKTGSPRTEIPEHFAAAHPELMDFVDWRCRRVARLIASLRQVCTARLVVHRDGDRYLSATDWPSIARHCDATLSTCPHDDDTIRSTVETALSDTGDIRHVELGFKATAPDCPDSQTLVRSAATAVAAGVRSINIYNYGLLSLDRLEWIRQTTRYAQREAGT